MQKAEKVITELEAHMDTGKVHDLEEPYKARQKVYILFKSLIKSIVGNSEKISND